MDDCRMLRSSAVKRLQAGPARPDLSDQKDIRPFH